MSFLHVVVEGDSKGSVSLADLPASCEFQEGIADRCQAFVAVQHAAGPHHGAADRCSPMSTPHGGSPSNREANRSVRGSARDMPSREDACDRRTRTLCRLRPHAPLVLRVVTGTIVAFGFDTFRNGLDGVEGPSPALTFQRRVRPGWSPWPT